MRDSSSSAADMFFLEQVPADLWLLLPAAQVATNPGPQFSAIGRATLAEAIGFDGLVEEFIGVELRAVTRQPDQAQSGLVGGDEVAGHRRAMHRVAIHDKIQLPCRLLKQATHELHEQPPIELAVEYHERKMDTVRDRRDHVAAKALPSGPDDRRLTHRGIAGSGDVVAAQAQLIAPVNHAPSPAWRPEQSPDTPCATSAQLSHQYAHRPGAPASAGSCPSPPDSDRPWSAIPKHRTRSRSCSPLPPASTDRTAASIGPAASR